MRDAFVASWRQRKCGARSGDRLRVAPAAQRRGERRREVARL